MSTIWQQLRACNESDENLLSSTSLGSSSCTLSYCQQENNAPFMCDGTLLGASLILQASYDSLHYLGRLLAMLLELRSGFEGFRAFLPSFLGNINTKVEQREINMSHARIMGWVRLEPESNQLLPPDRFGSVKCYK
ncbi:unnamed protein product [Musa hybrid cultivar]